MADKACSTPSVLLLSIAELADKHRLEMHTGAGDKLQAALVEFLRDGAAASSSPIDLQADLITLLPRFVNALVSSTHLGAACRSCSIRIASMVATEIIRDAEALSERQNTRGIH